jgi:hypothetical protein
MSTAPHIISEILADIRSVEDNTTLYHKTHFIDRTNALDFIDFHILDRLNTLPPNDKTSTLKLRGEKLKLVLEKVDDALFSNLRKRIQAANCIGPAFKKELSKYFPADFGPGNSGYDSLDAFMTGLFFDAPLPDETTTRKPEMVFYQQTPARVIFEMAERACLAPGDVFFDIGSGLGLVAILMHLLSGVPAIGIEYEPAYCHYAAACVSALNSSGVKFINTEAQNSDYSQGTVFFMYTPFHGSMLEQVLNLLRKQALTRPIRIFTYGPCSFEVAAQNWLSCINGPANDIYQLYEFKSQRRS